MIFEIDLLNDDDIKNIQLLQKNFLYNIGKLRDGKNSKAKVCDILDQNTVEYKQIYNIISNQIKNSCEISSLLSIKKMTPPSIVRYDKGGFYDWHIDELQINGLVPHYSTTIFLNDFSEYDGGELVLNLNGKETEYKLSSGKALVYPTGTLHKVNKVTEGLRLVSVFWMESLIKNEFLRNCVFEMGRSIFSLSQESINNNNTILDADKKILELEQIRINLLREYGNF